ncbi:amino acid ABC transporter permease [Paenibacillus sp. ISL-20]|uniref:amino acid ABC transporter permease n=1 Tax=Paenibacillus sp. ISL-20 TaxID=2819163 RepID=UPI001BE9C1CB|nr:amino acid ABC transporter permease [Paenibacillus sp. ISL-20]
MKEFDVDFIFRYWPQILPYLIVTFFVVAASVLLGLLLGFLLAAAKLGRNSLGKLLANGYTTILRCTPSVVLLFVVYYGLPALLLELFAVDINDIYKGIFVIVTLSLLFAATMSEVMRSAYQSIDKGQYEAAVCVGLTPAQAFRRIVLPQCFYVALPNFGNAIIALTKEGALAFTIGFIDITGKANLIVSLNMGAHSREIYLGLAIMYWMISFGLEKLLKKMEKWFGKGRRVVGSY